MSDPIKHECGIALVRLRKPLQYYIDKYGSPLYAINKMYLLMEKQHNRGQDGVGVATIKLDVPEGTKYISRYRSIQEKPIADVFKKINKKFNKVLKTDADKFKDAEWLQENCAFTGEVLLGHLRYGTHGGNSIESCHPFLRQSNWRSKNLVLAGNFNMTNVDELFQRLVDLGQHPKEKADTVTVMEKIGHFLDEENQYLFNKYKSRYTNREISRVIENELNLLRVLKRACKDFDGGYAMAGMTGYGATFVARDPAGIRPAYKFINDEVVVVASEKPAIKTAFGCPYDEIEEIKPGHALIVNKKGEISEQEFIAPLEQKSCSFERIYFSRGSDPQIYQERKNLGKFLVPQVLASINNDLENTVFSFIPNTAETSFLGMMKGMEQHVVEYRKKQLRSGKEFSDEELSRILTITPRIEKLVIKDAKLRTFITDDNARDDLVSNVYDTTYEVVKKNVDTIVVIDDSIVRGTTLEKSIIRMLDRLSPKKMVIVSSAPQIRYPDCYGIDMSKMKEFVAFRALLALLKEDNLLHKLDEVYEDCKKAILENDNEVNHVQRLYSLYTDDQISKKIAQLVQGEIATEVDVIFQSVDSLHKACPDHIGDWYFTGNYPTKGGNRVVNKSFIYFMEGKTGRAY